MNIYANKAGYVPTSVAADKIYALTKENEALTKEIEVLKRNYECLARNYDRLAEENVKLYRAESVLTEQNDILIQKNKSLQTTITEYEALVEKQVHFVAVSTNLKYCFPLYAKNEYSAAYELKKICIEKGLSIAMFKVFSEEDMN